MIKRKINLFLVIILAFFSIAAKGPEWLEAKGEHFIVYFTQDDQFARAALDKAERYYRNIADGLGYVRYKDFWTWDKRVKIYIYPEKDPYLEATGQQSWSEGMADYTNKQIASFINSQGFLDSVLPHEIAHLIFRDFVGFAGEVPLWLDEGVAQWAEEDKRQNVKRLMKDYYDKDNLMVVDDIMRLDIRRLKDKKGLFIRPTITKDNKEGVIFLSAENLVNLFYAQSASLIDYLTEKFGGDAFSNFCRQLRDGKSMQEALKTAYPDHIRDLKELERGWREYLAES